MQLEAQDVIEHGGENHCFDVMEAALVFEAAAELAGLFKGAELDLDGPAKRVDVADVPGGEDIAADVGDEDAPTGAQETFLVGSDAAAFGFAPEVASIGCGAFWIEADGDQAAGHPVVSRNSNRRSHAASR